MLACFVEDATPPVTKETPGQMLQILQRERKPHFRVAHLAHIIYVEIGVVENSSQVLVVRVGLPPYFEVMVVNVRSSIQLVGDH